MSPSDRLDALRPAVSGEAGRPAAMEWEADLVLFRSRVLLRQLTLALLIPVLGILALLVLLDWPPSPATWRAIGTVGLIVGATLLVLAVLALGLVYGGKYRFRHRLSDAGITADPVGATRRKNRVINALLVLSGRPSAMGAGILAQSRRHEEWAWSQIDRAVPEAGGRSIALHQGRRVVMLVACRPDNFETVLQEIRRYIGRAGSTA